MGEEEKGRGRKGAEVVLRTKRKKQRKASVEEKQKKKRNRGLRSGELKERRTERETRLENRERFSAVKN